MVNKRHKSRFFVVKIIVQKNVFVIFFGFGCKTIYFGNFEFIWIVIPNNNIYSRCMRFGRFYDFFFGICLLITIVFFGFRF